MTSPEKPDPAGTGVIMVEICAHRNPDVSRQVSARRQIPAGQVARVAIPIAPPAKRRRYRQQLFFINRLDRDAR
jgi:hypothetical protein